MTSARHGHGPRHGSDLGGALLRSFALGVAAGSRASLGVAAPLLHSGANRVARISARAGVLGELIGDKLPGTPSRLIPPGPQGRLAAGALGGVALARRAHRPVWSAAVVGAAGAAVGTWGGAAWRAWAVQRGPDWRGALAEDALALTLATLATRPRP